MKTEAKDKPVRDQPLVTREFAEQVWAAMDMCRYQGCTQRVAGLVVGTPLCINHCSELGGP